MSNKLLKRRHVGAYIIEGTAEPKVVLPLFTEPPRVRCWLVRLLLGWGYESYAQDGAKNRAR